MVVCLHRSFCLQNPSLLFCPFTRTNPQGILIHTDFLLFYHLRLCLHNLKKIIYHILLYIDIWFFMHRSYLCHQILSSVGDKVQFSSLRVYLAHCFALGGSSTGVCRLLSTGPISWAMTAPYFGEFSIKGFKEDKVNKFKFPNVKVNWG